MTVHAITPDRWAGPQTGPGPERDDGAPAAKLRPKEAATRYAVTPGYLRRLEATDPGFPAPWRRGRVVLHDAAAHAAYFAGPTRRGVAVTGGEVNPALVSETFRSLGRARRRARAEAGVAQEAA